MTLHQLRIFLAVAQSATLTRASKQLGLAQPSLSQQLARLEESVGARLFDRGNRMELTDAGRVLLRHAQSIVKEINEAEAGLREFAAGKRAVIRIAGLNSVVKALLPDALRRLYPQTDIDVVEVDAAVIRVAQEYFDFRPSTNVHVFEEDGRVFVKRAGRSGAKYDLVLLDAFDHEYIPEHMLTREFLQEVKAVMQPEGVLAANTFSTRRCANHLAPGT